MPTPTSPGYLGQQRRLGAALGTVLNTTRTHVAIPAGARYVTFTPGTFVTGVVAQIALNPYLTILKTTDLMVTNPTDYSENAQDGDAATLVTLSSQPALANGGAIYVGSVEPFSGINLTVVNGSGGAGTIGLFFWNGTAWQDNAPTDGTTNANATGDVTWTVQPTWRPGSLQTILALAAPRGPIPASEMYWMRWTTSVAYDATTTLSSVYSINRYGNAVQELPTGVAFESEIYRAKNGGNLQAIMNAGTGLLLGTGYYG